MKSRLQETFITLANIYRYLELLDNTVITAEQRLVYTHDLVLALAKYLQLGQSFTIYLKTGEVYTFNTTGRLPLFTPMSINMVVSDYSNIKQIYLPVTIDNQYIVVDYQSKTIH